MDVLESLKWRAAVRHFDTEKEVSSENLEKLIQAGNLTATSMGLQPFKMVVVRNKALQQELVPVSYNQQHVAEASHVLVFAIETNIGEDAIEAYINRSIELRNVSREALDGYRNSISGYISTMDTETKKAWATKQAYIALGTVMTAAADLKIDSCAMEGFDSIAYQEMLGLEEEGLLPVVILPIGYRSDKEQMANLPKVRKARENFVVEIN